ncbi:MAG: D-aminoacyl-tRNA deacylase [Methanomicrobiales archaeon]
MKITLVSSRTDPAGCNIHRHIHELLESGCKEDSLGPGLQQPVYSHIEVEGRLIFEDEIDRDLDTDLVIFLSRHASVHPVPVLTVHVTGNLGNAELGGKPGSLAPAAPAWMQAVLRNLKERAPQGYGAFYEVTHHGPTELYHPSFFVEIGSTEQEWRDETAGQAVAESVLLADPGQAIPLIGFGGTHYARRQTEIALSTQGAFGHIAHTRELEGITKEMISQMMDKSHAKAAFVDRKAIDGNNLSRIEGILQELEILMLAEHHLTGIGELVWEDYLRIRTLAASREPEAEVHVNLLKSIVKPVIIRISPELLSNALAIGGRQFLDRLRELPIAYLSTKNSPVLPVFITGQDQKETKLHDLITLCVSIIIINEATEIEGDHLIILKKKLDPGKARELGVPMGPLFGLLMKGEAVHIGNRVITPDMVQVLGRKDIHIPGLERYT